MKLLTRTLLPVAAVLWLGLFAGGCRSTAHHQEKAVARARKFLIENAPEFSAMEVAFVRYNKPTLLVENVLGAGQAGWSARSGRSQICVTWLMPERDEAYLVFGVSDIRMVDWYPNRLIRKKFTPPDRIRLALFETARRFIMDNYHRALSSHELNRIRFARPEVVRTRFHLTHEYDQELPPELLASLTQYSLVWPGEGGDQTVVVCGLANDDLSGFRILFGGPIDPEELAQNTTGQAPETKE